MGRVIAPCVPEANGQMRFLALDREATDQPGLRQRRKERSDTKQEARDSKSQKKNPKSQLEKAALACEKAQQFMAGKTVKKVIYVPKKLVNIVVG